eukprot:6334266-Prymnesium_polylepis.2
MAYPLPPEARTKLLRVRLHWVKSEAGVERFTIAVRAHACPHVHPSARLALNPVQPHTQQL